MQHSTKCCSAFFQKHEMGVPSDHVQSSIGFAMLLISELTFSFLLYATSGSKNHGFAHDRFGWLWFSLGLSDVTSVSLHSSLVLHN